MEGSQLWLLIAFMVFTIALMGGLSVLIAKYMKKRQQIEEDQEETPGSV